MIAVLMLYGIAVSTALALAALAAERLMRLLGRPARVVWIVAMLGACVLVGDGWISRSVTSTPASTGAGRRLASPVAAPATPPPVASSTSPGKTASPAPARFVITPVASISRFDLPLLLAWAGGSLVGFVIVLVSAIRLERPRRDWRPATIAGTPVFVSHDLGPAVVGVLRRHVVVPSWVIELSEDDRELVLAHERQHMEAGDPTLLLIATVLIVLCPWNIALWWINRRLQAAIELDCDARVLRHGGNAAAYGGLLLTVSERLYGGALPIAGMAERASLVEQRIAAFMHREDRLQPLRGALAATGALALAVLACEAPRPAEATAHAQPAVNLARAAARQPDTTDELLPAARRFVSEMQARARDKSIPPLREPLAQFSLELESVGQTGWLATCDTGCHWRGPVSFSCRFDCPAIVDPDGLVTFATARPQTAAFRFRVMRTDSGFLIVADGGTAWHALTWSCGGSQPSGIRITQGGIAQQCISGAPAFARRRLLRSR